MTKHLIYLGSLIPIVLWGFVASLELVDPFFLPGPIDVIGNMVVLFGTKEILAGTLSTLQRIGLAFILAAILGLPAGLLIGRNKKVYRSLEAVIDFSRSVPALAVFPLFIVIFGIGDSSKIAVAAFCSTFIVLFNTAHGVMQAKQARLLAAKIMGAKSYQLFTKIIIWESLPQMMVGLRVAMSWIIAVIIATEMFVGTNVGLGRTIIDYQITYNIKALYAAIAITGVLGYAIDLLFINFERRFIHWSGK